MPAPKPEPRLTARAIRPLVSGLRALGHDPAPLLAGAGIESALLDEPDAYVPMLAAVDLITRAVEATGDSNLGLRLAQSADLGSFDVHLYAMLSSGTAGSGTIGGKRKFVPKSTPSMSTMASRNLSCVLIRRSPRMSAGRSPRERARARARGRNRSLPRDGSGRSAGRPAKARARPRAYAARRLRRSSRSA